MSRPVNGLLAASLALLSCGPPPAIDGVTGTTQQAVVAGTPAPRQLRNVGTVVYWDGQRWLWFGGSGTLISPRVFLTAAHVLADVVDQVEWGVTFEPFMPLDSPHALSPDLTVYPARAFVHPQFTFDDAFDQQSTDPDVAVLVLDEPARGVRPAKLVQPGWFDRADPVGRAFGFAGYGFASVDAFLGNAPPDWGTRRYGTMALGAIFPGMVVLDRTGAQTPCVLDSGGPAFLADGPAERGELPAFVDVVTSTVRAALPEDLAAGRICDGSAIFTRLDTPAIQEFVRGFLHRDEG